MRSRTLYLHEAGTLLRLTVPLVLAQLAQTAMGFVDTVMAGRYSAVDLAAVAVGSSIFFPVYLFLIGLMNAVTPLVAQAHGRGDLVTARRSIRLGLAIGLACGLALMPLLWITRPFLAWMGVDAAVLPITDRFLFAISWGLPLGGMFFALKGGGDGMGRTRLSMFAGFVGLAVNVAANGMLIYGLFGLPRLGGVGCGWATALSILAMLLTMAMLLAKARVAGTRRLFQLAWKPVADRPTLVGAVLGFLRLGLPLGLTLFIECSIFTVIALFIAKLGAQVVAAHQIALNFVSQLYMVPYSLAMALTVRVGFAIGRKRPARVRRVVRTGLGLALTGAVCTCLLVSFFSPQIAGLYTQDPMVRNLAATLLIFGAVFQLPDALQVNCGGILRGCKDTRVPMLLMLMAYWGLGLPLGYGLGLARLGGLEPGPQGFWIGLICALAAAAVLLGGRVRLVVDRLTGTGRSKAGRP